MYVPRTLTFTAPLTVTPDADLDPQQGPAPGAVAALGGGRAIRRVVAGDYSTCPQLQLAMMGKLAEPEFRLPMCRMAEANRPRLKAVLVSLGLVKG